MDRRTFLTSAGAIGATLGLSIIPLGNLQRALAQATPVATPNLFAELGLPEVTVTATADSYAVSDSSIAAGRYLVHLNNQSPVEIYAAFLQLPEGVTADDFSALLTDPETMGPPEWYSTTFSPGGISATPGEESWVVLDLPAGAYAVHTDTPEAGLPAVALEVTGEMPADLPVPAATAKVDMVEMMFHFDPPIVVGPQIVEVVNSGEQMHFFTLAAVPPGTTVEDFMGLAASFTGTPTESPLAFEDIQPYFDTANQSPGTTSWAAINVDPGTYLAVCFVSDAETGAPHAMLGMAEILEIA